MGYGVLVIAIEGKEPPAIHEEYGVAPTEQYEEIPESPVTGSVLLVVGFYLVTIAFVLLTLKSGPRPVAALQAVDLRSSKIGLILCAPGVMHVLTARVLLGGLEKYFQPDRPARRFQGEVTLLRERAVQMGKDTKRPAADQKLDQQKVIAITQYVQKLGSVERAGKALDALEQLRRAA